MNEEPKPWYKSRTIISVIFAVVTAALAALGFDAELIRDVEAIQDGGITLMEVLTAVFTIAAAYFRKIARQPVG